jgi:hypothetical protein
MVGFLNKIVEGMSSKQRKGTDRIMEDCVQQFENINIAANHIERGVRR